MRKAEAYLNYAEAILRGGNTVDGLSALEAVNVIRQRANATLITSLVLDDILDERGREFSWEMVRRRDLIRFGKFNKPDYLEYVTAKDDYRKWFPIPFSVLEKGKIDETTGKRFWTQNKGYEDIQ